MFLKKQFKMLTDVSFFKGDSSLKGHEEDDKQIISLYLVDMDVEYKIEYDNIVYTKRLAKGLTHQPFAFSYALAEFVSFIASVHGTREAFDIDENGAFLVYNKKLGTLLRTTELRSVKEIEEPHKTLKNTAKEIGGDKAKELSQFLALQKRYSCNIPYFKAFNKVSLLKEGDLTFFFTNGVHSIALDIMNDIQSDSISYFIGEDAQSSQHTIKILSTYLKSSGDFHLVTSSQHLLLESEDESLQIPLNPNEDFLSEEDLYQPVSDEYMEWSEETIEQVCEMFNNKILTAYRKEHNFKSGLEVTCTLEGDVIQFDGNCERLKGITGAENKKFPRKTICCYHLVEFFNVLKALKVKSIRLYRNRFEGNGYRMYI